MIIPGIDDISLLLSAAVLLLALITPMFSPLFRRLRTPSRQPHGNAAAPPVTVLLVSNGDHKALDEHLPLYLTQEYASGYEVIVVVEKADSEAENVLKRYSYDKKLYHTFVPDTSRYMSKNKLAITLGVKAARNEWIVLTDPRCKPADSHWIEAMSAHFDNDTSMVLGYSNYTEEAPTFHRFERLHTALYLLRYAQGGRAFRTNCQHVSFRKSEYMQQNGFLEYLKFNIGEYDFLANKFGQEGRTAVAADESTWLWENPIHRKTWQNRLVYFHEVGRHLDGGGSLRLLRATDTLALHLCCISCILSAVFAGFTNRWILLGVSIFSLLLNAVIRSQIGKKAVKEFKAGIPAWKIPFLELNMARNAFLTRMRYEYADKNDFLSHKV